MPNKDLVAKKLAEIEKRKLKPKHKLEKFVQKDIIDLLSNIDNLYYVKIEAGRQKNTLDILGCYLGKFFAIEVKKEGIDPIKGLSKTQSITIAKINVAKGFTLVTNSVAEVDMFLKNLIK